MSNIKFYTRCIRAAYWPVESATDTYREKAAQGRAVVSVCHSVQSVDPICALNRPQMDFVLDINQI